MAFVRFQDLDVYRLSENLADSIWDIVCTWSGLARDTVGKQLIRPLKNSKNHGKNHT